ncbi:hypothetical protein [Bradyrhizobium sp.]|uniref:hypothetical protein n=1 Tax=Bradyrhizobium sp. TaxID=376 RepID=UPI002E0C6904|nr:hypothetical protein [Bradyrhizobium sp.]
MGDAARKNPISAALIGMGMLWLFTGGRTVKGAADLVRGAGLDRIPDAAGNALDAARSTLRYGSEAIGSGVSSIGQGVSSATETLRDVGAAGLDRVARTSSEVADTAYGYARNVPDAGGAMFNTARENLSELFRAQPLALGAVGLAIGAGIAAALPATDLEAEYFGEASDNFKEQAADFASEQVSRAATVAEEVVTAVSDEARKQGLTAEAAKSALADIPGKLGRVVDAAGKGVTDRVTSTAR